MKYNIQGKITAPFKGYSNSVAKQVGHQHTGQDESQGWLKPYFSDNNGYIYKVYINRYPKWQGVYLIVEDKTGIYETVDGHFKIIVVKEGDFVKKDTLLGFEGNAGTVFSNGKKITNEEKLDGSKAGHHCHRGIRPVKKVKKKTTNKHYLRNRKGNSYKDLNGYYYEIIHDDNDTKGWVDPMNYADSVSRLKFLSYEYEKQGRNWTANMILKVADIVKVFQNKNEK